MFQLVYGDLVHDGNTETFKQDEPDPVAFSFFVLSQCLDNGFWRHLQACRQLQGLQQPNESGRSISDSKEIESCVNSADLELGVTGSKSLERNLIREGLWEDELVLAFLVWHRWAERETFPVIEIKEEPFILRESGSGIIKCMANYLQVCHPGPLKQGESGNFEGVENRGAANVSTFLSSQARKKNPVTTLP